MNATSTPVTTGRATAGTVVEHIALPMSAGPHSDSRTVNVFILPGRPVTLVDAGMPFPDSLRALEAGLGGISLRLEDVEQLVITHTHPDHYGSAAAIVRATAAAGRRARVMAHPLAASILADLPAWWTRAREHSLQLLRRAGVPAQTIESGASTRPTRSPMADPSSNVAVDDTLQDGALVETSTGSWQVLHTPGHASTQLCLYASQRQEILSSDHLLPDSTANMVLEPPWPGEPPAHPILEYLASLRRLLALRIVRVWPGHGEPFGDDRRRSADGRPKTEDGGRQTADGGEAAAEDYVQSVVVSRIERCEQRLAQAAALVAEQPHTAWEVAEALYAGTPAAGSQRGMFQVIAYLDALAADGQIGVEDENGIWRYHRHTGGGQPTADGRVVSRSAIRGPLSLTNRPPLMVP